MHTEHPDAAELAALREAFASADGTALGWAGVRAFEAQHGVVLPEPYRTFVAEIADGSAGGPPSAGWCRWPSCRGTGVTAGLSGCWAGRSR